MLEIVCWKWRTPGYRSTFDAAAVNTLRCMVERNLSLPHSFTCVTDDGAGIDPRVRVVPLWNDYANVLNPSNPANPSCYRRLKMFSPDAHKIFVGERVVSMDLDAVITGDLTPLFDRPEDFVIWGGQSVEPRRARSLPYSWYNGSLMMLRIGARPRVWTEFDPNNSPRRAHQANCRGSDQGWIAFILGKNEKIWGQSDGVFSYRNHVIAEHYGKLPRGARFVAFHGRHDPWHATIQAKHAWVREFYKCG
jgi:hypothetical protein